MGKSLITVIIQWADFGLMVVLQWMTMLRVVAKQQINSYPQVVSSQWADSCQMATLQQMAMPRVVTNRRAYLTPQATSA